MISDKCLPFQMTTEIRQGFICPICLSDLGDVQQLQSHFAQFHKDTAAFDDGYISTQLKGG